MLHPKNSVVSPFVALATYLQVHSLAGLPQPLQTLFSIGAPHFLQGVHPQV
jgi:hypothetical protein